MKCNFTELNETETGLLNIEYIGKDKFMIIWKEEDNEKARGILKAAKIRTSREQHCNAGDWRFDNPVLSKVNTVFWVVTSKAAQKVRETGFAVTNLLLD